MDSNRKSTFITSLIDIDNNTDGNHVGKVTLAEFNIPHQILVTLFGENLDANKK